LKIALKYGLLTTGCFIVWVVLAHLLVPDLRSPVHDVGTAAFANIVEITAIALGIRARKSANAGVLSFKDGLKTGVGIAAVYGFSACLFFVVQILVFGPAMLAVEPGAETKPIWQVVLGAFLGLGLGAVLFGLIYSTVISAILATRRSQAE
jgi:hypothetical protein